MHPVEEYQNYNLDRGQVEWVRNCDAHKKKVGVELLYNSVHRKFNQFGDQTSWEQDAVEKASTQQSGPSGPRLSSCSWGSDELEIRCWIEEHVSERLGPQTPGWTGERERNAVMANRVGVNMLQFCSVSNSLSHTTLSNKVRGIFFQRTVSLVFIVSFACICIWVYNRSTLVWILFSFSSTACHTKAKEPSLLYHLPIAEGITGKQLFTNITSSKVCTQIILHFYNFSSQPKTVTKFFITFFSSGVY